MRGSQDRAGAVLASAALVIVGLLSVGIAAADQAVAQMGSTGGTLGNEDKSASGGGAAAPAKKAAKPPSAPRSLGARAEPPPPPKHIRPSPKAAVLERPEPPAPRRPAKAVSLASYDGEYAGASTGPCILRWSWSFQVVDGIMTGGGSSNISGRVNPTGAAAGKMVVFGSTYSFVGHLTATGASGTWVKPGPDGCSGTWTASK